MKMKSNSAQLWQSTALGLLVFAALFLFSFTGLSADTNAFAKLQNVHRVIFLGDSITYAGFYVADIAAYYDTRFPDQHVEFINLGLSSENVSGLSEEGHAGGQFRRPDLHERLARVLDKSKPDLAILCYGMNDGIYQPWDDGRFKAFQDGMKSVRNQITAAGAKVIHITPPVFDPVGITNKLATNAAAGGFSHPFGGYDEVLGRYSEWLLAQRSAGWDVADLHGLMSHWLADQRHRNPDFRYTKDGVHPDEAGHWVMAKQILLYLGAKDIDNVSSSAAMLARNPQGEQIWKLEHRKEQILRDAWLNFCGFIRPGLKGGLPVPEAKAKAADLDKQIHQLVSQVEKPSATKAP